jgi:mono/diheme cytochrome c family protein
VRENRQVKQLALALLAAFAAVQPMRAAAPNHPTYNKDIAPILNAQCVLCHRPGEVAPFSLLTYQDAAKRASLIATVTEKRFMPPWKPEPGYGSFQHERRLTDDQIALIAAWAKAGAPEGNPKDKPTPPVFAEGWSAGEPSKVVTMGNGHTVPADGPDQFVCFVVPLNLEEDAYLRTAEFRPGNRRVVHHGVIYVDESGAARKLAAGSADGSYPCFGGPRVTSTGIIAGWAPGQIQAQGDPQLTLPIKKGSDLVVQIHYHPSGKPETDISSIGLTFGDPPTKGRTSILMVDTDIDIPPGDSNYLVKTSLTLPRDVEMASVFPHAHLLCKDMKIDATLPDGTVTHLIWIKDWDFNWQGGYRFEKPLHLPKGTRIDLAYTFDNSDANTRNPSHPAKRVTFGEQTTDEMAVGFLGVILPAPADVAPFQRDMRLATIEKILESGDLSALRGRIPGGGARLQQMIKAFDKNGDGKLDADERAALMEFLKTLIK